MKKKYVCAACRHKREKCKADCLLAPYFPNHMPQQYTNALKVFGKSRLKKLLKSLNHEQRSTAMKHAIEEANLRVADPVGGSHRLIKKLELEIAREEEELSRVRCLLSVCRAGGGGINAGILARPGNAAGVGEKGYIVVEGGALQKQQQDCFFADGYLHALHRLEQQAEQHLNNQVQGNLI